jgi:heat shock protein HslJ
LNGDWKITSFKGKGMRALNNDKSATFSFDIENNRTGACVGCNRIGGGYEIMKNTLYFSDNVISTEMYCEDLMDLEKEMLDFVSGQKLKYKFVGETLVLSFLDGSHALQLIKE